MILNSFVQIWFVLIAISTDAFSFGDDEIHNTADIHDFENFHNQQIRPENFDNYTTAPNPVLEVAERNNSEEYLPSPMRIDNLNRFEEETQLETPTNENGSNERKYLLTTVGLLHILCTECFENRDEQKPNSKEHQRKRNGVKQFEFWQNSYQILKVEESFLHLRSGDQYFRCDIRTLFRLKYKPPILLNEIATQSGHEQFLRKKRPHYFRRRLNRLRPSHRRLTFQLNKRFNETKPEIEATPNKIYILFGALLEYKNLTNPTRHKFVFQNRVHQIGGANVNQNKTSLKSLEQEFHIL